MILDEIIRHKKKELKRSLRLKPLDILKKEALRVSGRKNHFVSSLKKNGRVSVIAEIKRRSPSKGLLCRNFDPVKIAGEYKRGGASALSVLTDAKYFGGSAEILKKVRASSPLPVLRKDFTVHEYQIYESKVLGADAILLIARVLSKETLKRFYAIAKKLGLEVLFEVHSEGDLKKVLPLKPRLVGINNRDLATFRVDLNETKRLSRRVPKRCLLVSESGISSSEDMAVLKKYGVQAVLVGELLMKDKSPSGALKRLLGNPHGSR